MSTLGIINGRIIDPASSFDAIGGVLVRDGKILSVGPDAGRADMVCDASGMIVAPGFVDLHVHLREPGKEQAETAQSGAKAAAAGGFTTIVAMPNTTPPIDNPDIMSLVRRLADEAGGARVEIAACITEGRSGRRPAPIKKLSEAGAAAFTDDGSGVADPRVLWEAMRLAAEAGRPIMSHCEDPALSGGVIHQGFASDELELPGIPSEAESVMVARDIAIAQLTGARLHIQHVSAAASVELIRAAKRAGVSVTAEATPHHIALIDEDILDAASPADFKMNPPLRSRDDREAIIEALRDGTIDCIATDHAPHTPEEKARGLRNAPFGVIGLENALGVLWTELVETKILSEMRLIELLTCRPAAVIGAERGALRPGAEADITIIDPQRVWTIDPTEFISKSRNCPFAGRRVTGKAVAVFVGGELRYAAGGFSFGKGAPGQARGR